MINLSSTMDKWCMEELIKLGFIESILSMMNDQLCITVTPLHNGLMSLQNILQYYEDDIKGFDEVEQRIAMFTNNGKKGYEILEDLGQYENSSI